VPVSRWLQGGRRVQCLQSTELSRIPRPTLEEMMAVTALPPLMLSPCTHRLRNMSWTTANPCMLQSCH
jgi:hypothetical protein